VKGKDEEIDPETFPIPLFEREENVLMASFSFHWPSTFSFFSFKKESSGRFSISGSIGN
jgi:hypothetical protein